MHLYLRYILLSFALEVVALCQGFGKKKQKKTYRFSQGVFSVFGFAFSLSFAVLQMCVGGVYTRCVHTQSSLSVFTMLDVFHWTDKLTDRRTK